MPFLCFSQAKNLVTYMRLIRIMIVKQHALRLIPSIATALVTLNTEVIQPQLPTTHRPSPEHHRGLGGGKSRQGFHRFAAESCSMPAPQ